MLVSFICNLQLTLQQQKGKRHHNNNKLIIISIIIIVIEQIIRLIVLVQETVATRRWKKKKRKKKQQLEIESMTTRFECVINYFAGINCDKKTPAHMLEYNKRRIYVCIHFQISRCSSVQKFMRICLNTQECRFALSIC